MKVTIINLQKKIPINPKRIKKAVLKVFSNETTKKSGEITICFVNDKWIREVNLNYLAQDTPTDVIAFDITAQGDKKNILADIAISTDTAVSNSRIFKTSPPYEVYLYVVHGLLHLLGYDDRTQKQRRIMEQKALYYLNKLNIKGCFSH